MARLLVVVLAVAAIVAARVANAADSAAGQVVFNTYCAGCHGTAAQNFNNIWAGANNPTAIELQIQKPASPMGYLGDLLSSTDIANVASYLAKVAGVDTTITPQTGLWWNPNESGSGYALDARHGVLVVTIYSYRSDTGEAQWYLAAGPLTNNGSSFTATLDKYRGGQCIACAYAGRPTLSGNDGTISIEFSSNTSATVHLPGGRVTTIEPQPF